MLLSDCLRENCSRERAALGRVVQAAAALKARSLAQTEEKQIQSLISQIVKRQLTKLQSKLANFEKVRVRVLERSPKPH